MLGAIIGDIVGSRFEFAIPDIKSKQFAFYHHKCKPTDDSIMTLAIANAILSCGDYGNYSKLAQQAVLYMRDMGRRYPKAGYGGRFRTWLHESDPKPYGSLGNGAAMRVSPCAHAAGTLEEAISLSKTVTEVTHNHKEGIKGAEATTVAIYMALHGSTKDEICNMIAKEKKYYNLSFTLDQIRPDYKFDETCQGTVPQAIVAFLESTGFEDAIRNAISIGGDSDTVAAITGSIAEAYYGIPANIRHQAFTYLNRMQIDIVDRFEAKYGIVPEKNQEEGVTT